MSGYADSSQISNDRATGDRVTWRTFPEIRTAPEHNRPNRIVCALMRNMRAGYMTGDYLRICVVIDSSDPPFEATWPEFTPYYEKRKTLPALPPDRVVTGDRQMRRGGRT